MKYLQRLNLNWKNDLVYILEKKILIGDDLNSLLDFIPKDKVKIAQGIIDFLHSEDIKDKADIEVLDYKGGDKVFSYTDSKGRTKTMSINKMLSYLGYDTKNVSQLDMQMFVSYFMDKTDDNLKEVKGNAIKDVYLVDNYDESIKDINSKQSIYGSCMRHNYCQDYLDIYIKNPNQVSCLVLFNNDNKVQARALIWNAVNGNRYMDTIYATNDTQPLFINYAKKHNIKVEIPKTEVTITLDKKIDYKYYPYMDTFMYLNVENKQLSNTWKQWDSGGNTVYKLRDTKGGKKLFLVGGKKTKWKKYTKYFSLEELIELGCDFDTFKNNYIQDERSMINESFEVMLESDSITYLKDLELSKQVNYIIKNNFDISDYIIDEDKIDIDDLNDLVHRYGLQNEYDDLEESRDDLESIKNSNKYQKFVELLFKHYADIDDYIDDNWLDIVESNDLYNVIIEEYLDAKYGSYTTVLQFLNDDGWNDVGEEEYIEILNIYFNNNIFNANIYEREDYQDIIDSI